MGTSLLIFNGNVYRKGLYPSIVFHDLEEKYGF